MKEKEICNKIIKALQEKGFKATSLCSGTFDILYVDKNNKYNVIEVKTMTEDNLKRAPKVEQTIGIEFTPNQTKSFRELFPITPIVIVEEHGKYYFIDSLGLNRLINDPERAKYKKAIVSKKYLESFGLLEFEAMIQKLIE